MIFFLSALFGQRIAFDVFLAVFEVAFCIFRVSRRIDDELAQLCLKLFLGQRGKLFVEFLRGLLDIAENQGVSVIVRRAVNAACRIPAPLLESTGQGICIKGVCFIL